MNPRYALAIGALFAVIAVSYALTSHDAGGATMLGALALGMGFMWYVLIAGSRRSS